MSDSVNQVIRVKLPPAFSPLVQPRRYKNFYGGRGAAKSWAFARVLAARATSQPLRVLCTREYQSSIRDSVHRLLTDQINYLGLNSRFNITRDNISSDIGAEFIFKGLHANIQEIKSTEGVDICWVEEAQAVSEESWSVLIPTIRYGKVFGEEPEIWLSWNTGEVTDPAYQRFVVNTPDNCCTRKVSWRDNPYFPKALEAERLYLLRVDPEAYEHIWEGAPRSISDVCIFKGKFFSETFEEPPDITPRYGSDWGFSQDPTTLIRFYVHENVLYISHEAYGVGVELDEIPELYDSVVGSREWPILADNSRPDTISHLRRRGFNIKGAPKSWKNNDTVSKANEKGSVKEGITFIRQFERIVIHPRCKHTFDEFKFYSYKKDRLTNEILPIIVDKWNHCIDAIRYGLYPLIRGKRSWVDVVGEE